MSLDSAFNDEPLEMEADPELVLHTGVYKCLSCEAEFGESEEFTVIGEADPFRLCAEHPENDIENFELLKDEDGNKLVVDVEPLRLQIEKISKI